MMVHIFTKVALMKVITYRYADSIMSA